MAEPPVIVTERATEHIKAAMAEKRRTGSGVRVGLVSNSCSLYSYNIDFENVPDEQRDLIVESRGLRLFIAKKSLAMLAGTTIDYDEQQGGLTFANPNIRKKSGLPVLQEDIKR